MNPASIDRNRDGDVRCKHNLEGQSFVIFVTFEVWGTYGFRLFGFRLVGPRSGGA